MAADGRRVVEEVGTRRAAVAADSRLEVEVEGSRPVVEVLVGR